MNLAEFIKLIARRWVIIVSFTFIGILLVWTVAFKFPTFAPKKQSFVSNSVLLVDQPAAQGAAASAALTRLLIVPQTYKQIIESNTIATAAAERLGGKYEAAEIMACTSAAPELATQVMAVSSCGDSPSDAVQVTNAVNESFIAWLTERQDAANVIGANRLVVSVITAPQEPAGPSGLPPAIWIFVGIFGGLILGLITAVGVESVQSVDEPGVLPAVPGPPLAPTQPYVPVGAPVAGAPYAPTGQYTLPAATGGRATRRPRRR